MFSPLLSAKISPKVSSPKQDGNDKASSTLSRRSVRAMDYKATTSVPTSPLLHHDLSTSSADSDSESRVCLSKKNLRGVRMCVLKAFGYVSAV